MKESIRTSQERFLLTVFVELFTAHLLGKEPRLFAKMDCVANIVGYIVFNILTINPSFLDEIQNVFLSK